VLRAEEAAPPPAPAPEVSVRKAPVLTPSNLKFNSAVTKSPQVLASAGQALTADGKGKSVWANVLGTNIGSGQASNGMVLQANGNGGSVWGTLGNSNSSLTVTAGTGLTGGGLVSLGGSTTLALGSNLTLGGTTTGTFSGPLTGNVTGNVTGTAASFTGTLAGDVTGQQSATAIAPATVTGKTITGFVSGAGTVTASDTILTAVNKLDGNVALKAPLASPTFTGNVGIGATSATSSLAVAGVIESTSGGVKFPDGTAQTTAATGTGAAQFVRTIQSPNNSVPAGTAFTIDTQVSNSVPTAIVASAGNGGTVYTLATGV
jgi:hypothetical protein